MTGFNRVRDGFFDEHPCWFNLTELPLCVGKVGMGRKSLSCSGAVNVE
jgi:hypothetical protein